VIGFLAFENHAPAHWPCGLALNSQEIRAAYLNDEVIGVATAKRNQHIETTLNKGT
jgi:hypothetical protein